MLHMLGMDVVPFDAVRPVAEAGRLRRERHLPGRRDDDRHAQRRRGGVRAATFRAPELFRGIADTHYAHILPRQIGPARARDMLLTGRKIDAATALEWGLVSRVVPHDQLMVEAVDALEMCCRAAPEARAAVNRSFHEYYGHYDRMAMEASIAGEEIVEGWAAFARSAPRLGPGALRRDERI